MTARSDRLLAPISVTAAEARPRMRVCLRGEVSAVGTRTWRGGLRHVVELHDGTGSVLLIFSRPTGVPGMHVGVRCQVKGTVQADSLDGLAVLWDPFYELLPCAGAP